ncbi:glucan 1,4-alpha-glucosidase [Agrobacterium vitis]|uniref:glucan 1,4-alpha-glucosidase n=1 Tax=Agrobacterium vitis TaxID=373 RepID=UPI0012E9606B|nr:glucan 1,4-alpha-glucosidase [Agrobacterium vitis]MVA37231.1 glucan 1,4-alpha-glucosidase [Agrobacterium vitis]
MTTLVDFAPGNPGIQARWTSSAKSGLGTALSARSPVWFTLSHGVLNEVYYPRVDSACIRDLGLLVIGPEGYFSEEKRDCTTSTHQVESGVLAFDVVNISRDGRYRIEKRIISDPARATVLQRITFRPLVGNISDYKVYALLAPHLVNAGMDNSAWIGEQDDTTLLFASGRSRYLALGSSLPWGERSAGFAGQSDGYSQLLQNGSLHPQYQRADDGNTALTGQIPFTESADTAVLALSFGQSETEAGAKALASLRDGFDVAFGMYCANWRGWQKSLYDLDRDTAKPINMYRVSTAVLAAHRAADRRGAVVASLSIPWGASKGDDDLGGYHLVWPRDLVENAGGFLAAGDWKEAIEILEYLREVQLASGRWPQNLWLDGKPYWLGVQMDECAFPILLADLLYRNGHLPDTLLTRFLPMIRKAAGYIIANGPATSQDRWEEDGGYSPFTLAVEIAALLAAADSLDVVGEPDMARHLRETADCWNEQIENWTYTSNSALCDVVGVEGYYVRIGGLDVTDMATGSQGQTIIRNRAADTSILPTGDVISPDALALVRFGLRAADDPRILDTIKVIDHQLKIDLPQGPLWYRYTGDGYGEHPDGSPFDGIGQGRPWPLLAGERAHYELTAGNRDMAERLLKTLEASAGTEGLLPEQSWDGPDLPERELFLGRPSGSAMPLVWAHAEYIKLLRSLNDGAVFDMPPQTVERYVKHQTPSTLRIWRFNNQISTIPHGKTLRLELEAPALVHWSATGWHEVADTRTRETGLGTHVIDIDLADGVIGQELVFTFFWEEADLWENANFKVQIIA